VSANPQLPGVFHHLAPVLDHYGYLAMAGVGLFEDSGVPVPGDTTLMRQLSRPGSAGSTSCWCLAHIDVLYQVVRYETYVGVAVGLLILGYIS